MYTKETVSLYHVFVWSKACYWFLSPDFKVKTTGNILHTVYVCKSYWCVQLLNVAVLWRAVQHLTVQLEFDRHSSAKRSYLNRHVGKRRRRAFQGPPWRDKLTTSGLITQTETHAAWHTWACAGGGTYESPYTQTPKHTLAYNPDNTCSWYRTYGTWTTELKGNHSNYWLKNLCA